VPLAPAPPALSVTRRVPYGQMGGFSALFTRYAEGDPDALAFYAHDWRSPEARAEAARRAAALPRDRHTLADVLLEQNEAWGNLDAGTLGHIAALRDPEGAAVVTGQQLGLFGGPLYTVYKAVTTVQLARRLAEETGRPVAPVFWLAGEDHDWEEVRAAVVSGPEGPRRIELPAGEGRQPVGRRVLGEEVGPALAALAEAGALPGGLAEAYREGASHAEAFGRWMAHLFAGTGLVLCSPDDPRLKALATPLFRREIEAPDAALDALLAAGGALSASGFHQQVTPLPGNLFLMEPEGRFTLDPEGDGFTLRGLGGHLSRADLLDRLAQDPGAFSPNVVLRPLLEATLLPSAAYVAGPGEAAYYAQLRGVYEASGVPMPVIYPRASATLVDGRTLRILDRYGLAVEAFAGGRETLDALHRRLALEASAHDVPGAFAEAEARIAAALDALRPVVEGADPTLARSAASTRAVLLRRLAALQEKTVRAEKRTHVGIRRDLDRAGAWLAPFGTPQERVLSPVAALRAAGPYLAAQLIEALSLDTSAHQVVQV
jgi:bacillithiol synthase